MPTPIDPAAEDTGSEPPVGSAATPPSPPGLSMGDGLALAALFIAVFAAVGIPFGVTRWMTGWEPGGAAAVLVAEMVAAAVTIGTGLRWAGLTFRVACPVRHYPLRIAPGLLLGSLGASIVFGELTHWIPGSQAFQRALLLELGQSSMLAVFLTATVGAPVLEELFCRGVLLSGLRRRYAVTPALWLSALFFAIAHLNPWQAVGALPLGLAWGWLVLRTGSVVPGILSHAMVNFSSFFLVGPLLFALGYDLRDLDRGTYFPPAMLALGAAAALLGTVTVWLQLRRWATVPVPAPGAPVAMPAPAGAESMGAPAGAESTPTPAAAEPGPAPAAPESVPASAMAEPVPALPMAERLPAPAATRPARSRLRLATTMTAAIVLVGATPVARLYLARRHGLGDLRPAGCYALQLPAGTRARLFPGASGEHVRVRLSERPYRRAWEDRQKYLVQALDPAAEPPGEADGSPVYWFAAARGNLRIVGQRGSGLTLLRLRRQGDGLSGEARHYSGIEGEPVHTAGPVSGRRIECPATPSRTWGAVGSGPAGSAAAGRGAPGTGSSAAATGEAGSAGSAGSTSTRTSTAGHEPAWSSGA